MPHLIITSSTTNVMIAMTTTSTIVAPVAITGRADEPTLKTKYIVLIIHKYMHSINILVLLQMTVRSLSSVQNYLMKRLIL